MPPPSEPEAQAVPADYADDDYTDEAYADEAYAEEEPAPRRPRRRLGGFVLPVAAGAVIFALIGGVYFAFFSGPGEPGEAPVLTADASPLKEDAPPQSESTASESVVFSEIEGNGGSPEDEALVSRDQTNGASGAQVAEVLAPEDGETALANRPVRTVTVRPDGTIVQATDSVAGSNVLPVERPDVPAVPNSTLPSDPIGEAIALAMADGETAAASQTEAPAADASEALPEAASTPETADETETGAAATAEDAGAPVPVARPAGLTAQDTTASKRLPLSRRRKQRLPRPRRQRRRRPMSVRGCNCHRSGAKRMRRPISPRCRHAMVRCSTGRRPRSAGSIWVNAAYIIAYGCHSRASIRPIRSARRSRGRVATVSC